MKISRRSFSCGLFGAGALVGAMPSAEKGSVRIAHLCDPQFGFVSGRESMKWRAAEHFAKNHAEDIVRCEKAIERINALGPDLLLFGGDMVQNSPISLRKKRLEAYVSAGARFMLTAHQHRLAVRGYKTLTILGAEALCGNFDIRPCGFRILEVNPDFSHSWNFVEV